MHRFWLGLHILLAVCLIPGPSWANTSKRAQSPDLTVENVWQHEVQKGRQAMRIKILRDMGLEPMSVAADKMALKIKNIFQNELNKINKLPAFSDAAVKQQRALYSDLGKFEKAMGRMYISMKKYKENKISATRAHRELKEQQIELFKFFKSPFGSKVYALLQDEIRKNHKPKQNIIFVRGELGADFKNEYKKVLQNPVKEEQFLKSYEEILPLSEDAASKTAQPKSFRDRLVSLLNIYRPTKGQIKFTSYSFMALMVANSIFYKTLLMGAAVTALQIVTFVFMMVPLFFALMAIFAGVLYLSFALFKDKNMNPLDGFKSSFDRKEFNLKLQTLLKYNLFQEVKREAHSKPTR